MRQQGGVTWDIYTANIRMMHAGISPHCLLLFITLHEGIQYQELPDVLTKYDVGVILYTGHIENYIYNAPNKLFEYLACGLDVWFPDVMKGSMPYLTTETYPKVMAVDFNQLDQSDYLIMSDHTGLVYKEPVYFCESPCWLHWENNCYPDK